MNCQCEISSIMFFVLLQIPVHIQTYMYHAYIICTYMQLCLIVVVYLLPVLTTAQESYALSGPLGLLAAQYSSSEDEQPHGCRDSASPHQSLSVPDTILGTTYIHVCQYMYTIIYVVCSESCRCFGLYNDIKPFEQPQFYCFALALANSIYVFSIHVCVCI